MTLARGREYLAIPGPSVMPDRVLRAMHRAAPNIYTGALVDMMPDLVARLKRVARTEGHCASYIGNGHAVWEASLSNVLSRGDTVLVLGTGRFAIGWGNVASGIGARVETLDFGKRDALDLDRVAQYLGSDAGHRIKAVLAVQTDTSTSVHNDIAGLRKAMDAAGHPALLMADCMASLGCERFEMDAWGVDVMVAGCQKGLMTPPGMAFVFFNDRAAQARESANCVTPYWDWVPRAAPPIFSDYFYGTAPTHHLYGLSEALDMLEEEGLENAWARHATLARAIWAAFEAWGAGGPLELNIADPTLRSNAVTAVRLPAPNGTRLRDWVERQTGVTLGIGLGMAPPTDPAWHGFFRVGHMGHVNAHMVLGALGAIEAGLLALDIPHGDGALSAAAAICARG